MTVDFYGRNKIFILGAGASIDYGLPSWIKLNNLLIDKLDKGLKEYEYEKEIRNWISKVGESKKYATIDECINKESESEEFNHNGFYIEQQIFSLIKEVLDEEYKENKNGWIKILNENIKNNRELNLENRISFINYNYDNVLDKNLINYSYVSQKRREADDREILENLSDVVFPILYPHGTLVSEENYKLNKHIDTNKFEMHDISAVTCHNTRKHTVKVSSSIGVDIFVLGLGGGLEVNLNNIIFSNTVKKVYITVKDKNNTDRVKTYMSKRFSIPLENIFTFEDCEDLINKAFN